MKNGQNQRRSRGRSSNKNQGRKSDGNRNDQRMRGNAPQLLDKFKGLARDALAAGDRILAENYFQHADHYQRLVNERDAIRAAQQEERDARRQNRDDENNGDAGNGEAKAEPDEGDASDDASGGQKLPRPSRTRRAKAAEDAERTDDGSSDNAPEVNGAESVEDAPAPKRRARRPRKAAAPEDAAADNALESPSAPEAQAEPAE